MRLGQKMITFPEERHVELHNLLNELVTPKYDDHLHKQLHEAASWGTLLLVGIEMSYSQLLINI